MDRLSDVEALMWTLEGDPHLSATFANITLFDRPVDAERFRRRMQRALLVVPRLRQRVVPTLGGIAPPHWQDDPDLDLDVHIRRVALPAPGTDRQLFDLATELAHAPFDRDRPLWEFTIFDGLAGGRGAMLQKIHHTITDGEGGVRMSTQFIDLAADAPEPPMPDGEPNSGSANPAGPVQQTIDVAAHALRRQTDVTRQAARAAGDLATHPQHLPGIGADALATARSLLRQLAVSDRARSPVWRARTLDRRFSALRVPFAEARRTAKALGGSINDFFVAGAAGGAGAYHRALGKEVDELRIAMPVSTRSERSATGNAFAPSRVLVPTGADPVTRFAMVSERLGTVKAERALSLVGALAGAVNLLPAPVLVRLARAGTATVDFTTSNVRGAPFELYIAGARIEANHPMGPLGGTAWNLTTMSYNGSLDMGLNVDTGAVEHPELLHRSVQAAFNELLAAGRQLGPP